MLLILVIMSLNTNINRDGGREYLCSYFMKGIISIQHYMALYLSSSFLLITELIRLESPGQIDNVPVTLSGPQRLENKVTDVVQFNIKVNVWSMCNIYKWASLPPFSCEHGSMIAAG